MNKTEEEISRFKSVLDDQYSWPSEYMFKFVVPADSESKVVERLATSQIEKKFSKTGKFVSVTSKLKVHSSDEVLKIYQDMSNIPGVVSL